MRATEDQKDLMVKYYLSGKTAQESSEIFNLGYGACLRALKAEGITPRNRTCKYYKDEAVFETIDTANKAYWLGFIVADGYVTDNTLAIRLKASDVEHLEKFKKFVNTDCPIKLYIAKIQEKEYEACGIYISSKKIVGDLGRYGVVKNKTLSAYYPNKIPNEFEHDFWRGFLDGDGCITYATDTKRNRTIKRWSLNVTGGIRIISDFQKYIKTILNTTAKIKKKSNSNFAMYFSLTGNNSLKIVLDNLYKDADTYLSRKYNLYRECEEQPTIRKNRDGITSEYLYFIYEKYRNWNTVASILGTSRGHLHKLRVKLGVKLEKVGGNSLGVEMYDKDLKFIRHFASSVEASKFLRITANAVRSVCSGKNKATKEGFILRYAS